MQSGREDVESTRSRSKLRDKLASFLSKTRRFAFRKSRPFIVLGTGAARIPRTGETIAGAASLRVHRPETTFRNSVAVALLAVLASFVLGWLTSHSVDAFSG
jgi:hypothetical protein